MDYSQILELAGNSGKFQIILFVLLGLSNMYPNIENMASNFLNPAHTNWCAVPNITGDDAKENFSPLRLRNDTEICYMYGVNRDEITGEPLPNSSVTTKCTDGHYFEQGEYEITATSEFNLVCDKASIRSLISPIYTSGVVIGAFGGGMISDRFGRLAALVFFNFVHLVAGIATALSVNEWMFMFGRMILALCYRASNNTGAVFMLEALSPEHRIRGVIGYQLFYGLGGLFCVGLAFFIRNWRFLQMALVAPLLPMIAYKWTVPESSKWLFVKGRIQESANAFLRIAQINGRDIPSSKIEEYVTQGESDLKLANESCETNKVPVSFLFRHPVIRLYLLAFLWTMSSANFIFFGVTLNIDQLFGNVYLNVLVAVLTEFPAYLLLWPGLTLLGRKPTLMIYMGLMFLLSALGIGASYLDGMEFIVTIIYVLIRGIANSCICIHLCFVSEVFPTSIRQMALGLIHAVAGGASIAASQTGKPTKDIWEPLPLAIYGSMALMSVVLTVVLPETLGESLPDTVEDTCNLGAKRLSGDSFDNSSKKSETSDIINRHFPINNSIGSVSKSIDVEKNYKRIEPILDTLQNGNPSFVYDGPESISGSFNIRL